MKTISMRGLSGAAILAAAAALAPMAAATPASASGVTVTSHFVVIDDPSTNVSEDSAYLDNGATDAQPHAIVFAALNDTSGGVCGCALVTKPLGVWYDLAKEQWAVFTEDVSAMPASPSFNKSIPISAAFNVMVGSGPSNGGKTAPVTVTSFDHHIDSDFSTAKVGTTFNVLIFSS